VKLPIEEIAEQVTQAARQGGGVVLQSPTGSGKSTRVPQLLLDALPAGEIWVLEPRRLAVRSLAHWVARQRGGEIGGEVGYRVRFESRTSPQTRLVFLTPGTALRMVASNPTLAGVAAVCLDEFHERGADADALASLALSLMAGPRPDLRLWILSATLDAKGLLEWFGKAGVPARILASEGRSYPVEISHQSPQGGEPTAKAVARALRQVLSNCDGDVLVFLPGQDEIRRAATACQEVLSRHPMGATTSICSLHGELDPREQDEVVRPSPPGRFKVILSTNVAETSLTLPGIRHVIDSGLVRRARHDALRDLNTLWTVRASRRSAQQRAGRAGRVAAGTCLRLWDPQDLPPEEDPPEVERLELSGLWLQLMGLGIAPQELPWPTPPPTSAVKSAARLLRQLGACDDHGNLTPVGKALAQLPVSPRTGRALLEAQRLDCLEDALDWACQHEAQGPEEARKLRERLRQALPCRHRRNDRPLGRLLLPAFCDRLAVSVGQGRYRLSDGRAAQLDTSQEGAALLLVLELQETVGRDRGPALRLRKAEAVEDSWIREVFGSDASFGQVLEWDGRARRVAGREVFSLFGQELSSRPVPDDRIDRLAAEALLAEQVANGTIRWKWGEDEEEWALRVRLAAKLFPERNLSVLDESDMELVRSALCEGCLAAGGIENRAVLPYLREVLGHEACSFVESMLPVRMNLPNSKRARIEYRPDGPPLVQARISDLIGVKSQQVRIAQGRTSILWEILAPNHRPVQRTADLDGFWTGSYPEIRKDLARRYPRHPWP